MTPVWPWRSIHLVLALLGLTAIGGCAGLRLPWPGVSGAPKPDWSVQTLLPTGLARQPEPVLQRCATRLGLKPERAALAHPTNFGDRQAADGFARAVPHQPQLIVLHETVFDGPRTVAFFQTPHPNDADQASYHLVIERDGRRLRIVPDGKRAYGAGRSAFGDFSVRIKPTSLGSINNVALHLSLVSPADGLGDGAAHSGYTPAQYNVAAAQVLLWQARFGLPLSRLTTHAAVDRSRSRYDPRSFRWDRFMAAYVAAARRCALESYDNGRASP
ncbi:N-acetylmuramoyl-L-alanine amidase [Cyanobium sp. Morenito 9A2]|uniref:N-acetylmuramoyl-L-alanine amidase n=1 Tax=Cyanobium sp. Morenito 9A2 TaxID=2823718 RepID=UPI0020CDD2D3|nr:peptidoglycan recognition family protein [Cyanobium sp. Morenito 9A2]MCP9849232.1 N-acetylmuramoyl-L-alanine amidase [Cyanobium sp. Morenito 9A2]